MAARTARICLLVSLEGKEFRQVYQHSGATFYGHTDRRPLAIPLQGVTARFLRLALPGRDYLHLDEVEVFARSNATNIALGKPATQSSVSQWSVAHSLSVSNSLVFDIGLVAARGRKLAASLRRLGVNVDAEERSLRQTETAAGQLANDASEDQRRSLYVQARQTVRQMALRNPLLNFDSLLFVKRAPPALSPLVRPALRLVAAGRRRHLCAGGIQRPSPPPSLCDGAAFPKARLVARTSPGTDATFYSPTVGFSPGCMLRPTRLTKPSCRSRPSSTSLK